MNYKDAFATDDVYYTERKKHSTQKESEFVLNNFDYYKPKLVKDFYLKYFVHELLFMTDIMELNSFLEYHYDYCDNPELLYRFLNLKVIPKIRDIVKLSNMNIEGVGYFEEQKLDDGFIESEGVIHNSLYNYPSMIYRTSYSRLQIDFEIRLPIIQSFLDLHVYNGVVKPLKWIAGPSQLGVIIRELIDKGYMEAEENRGEINVALLSRELLQAFSIKDCNSTKSIEVYLSAGNPRYIKAKARFDSLGFSIPIKKYI